MPELVRPQLPPPDNNELPKLLSAPMPLEQIAERSLSMSRIVFNPKEFTVNQLNTFSKLQVRYKKNHGIFTEDERNRLRFIRWILRTGRITP